MKWEDCLACGLLPPRRRSAGIGTESLGYSRSDLRCTVGIDFHFEDIKALTAINPRNQTMASPAQPASTMAAFARMAKGQVRNYSAPLEMAIPQSKKKYIPSSGTYPKGFSVSGTHVGVKASNTKYPDLALISSETPCSAAAVFTTNKFQAAPVQVSRETLRSRQGQGIRSVVINSGCANAVTGKGGVEDAVGMGAKVDECNGLNEPSTLVMSTGVIGQRYISTTSNTYMQRDC